MIDTSALASFCCDEPALFVVPIEALHEHRIDPAIAAMLAERRGLNPAWIHTFEQAFATWWDTTSVLARRASEHWLPPRIQNVCVVTDPAGVRPFYQPIDRASWLVYADDFAPDRGFELGAYRFALCERIAATRDALPAIVESLSWFLARDEEAIAVFVAATAQSQAPDREILRAVAEAIPAIRSSYHVHLRPPPPDAGALQPIRHAQLLAPPTAVPILAALGRRLRDAVAGLVADHRSHHATTVPTAARELVTWIRRVTPSVLVAHEGAIVWDPANPDRTDALAHAIEGIGARPAASLRADLEIVSDRTRAFLSSLRDRGALPMPGDEVEQEGGVYLHRERRLVAYDLVQPGLAARDEAGPPMHRRLLAARTIHEWGHLAEAAGWIGVQPNAEADHRAARQRVAECFDALLDAAPPSFVESVHAEARALGSYGSPGELVARLHAERMSDYAANCLAQRYLAPAELATYLRANAVTHEGEGLGPLQLLTRYVYEMQYLRLLGIDDPVRYVLASTWLGALYVDTGLVDRDRLHALDRATASVCATYWIDPAPFQ